MNANADDGPRQLAFDLALAPRMEAQDFLVGACNVDAHAMVMGWPVWPDPVLRLQGPPGSGKTHLARIFLSQSRGRLVDPSDLASEGGRLPALLTFPTLVLEDADRSGLNEAGFFHLLNLVRDKAMRGAGGALLITAATGPESWGLRTADLVSRLRLAPMVAIAPPDDVLMRALIVKLFHDRQLAVETNVIDYLAPRLERSFAAAAAAVAELDALALGTGRPITRALAALWLGNTLPPDDEEQG
jgi:chromosomal replication initiation ATPase DnaA